MRQALKTQWYLMLRTIEFKLAFSLVTALTLFSYLSEVVSCWGAEISTIKTASDQVAISAYGGVSTYLVYLLCFAIVLPFSLSYVVDRENQATVFFLSRSDKKTYLRAKMSMCFIGGAILVALPLLVNLFLCAVTFPDTHTYYIGSYGTGNYARSLTGTNQLYSSVHPSISFLKVYLWNPWLYHLLYVFLLSAFCGLLSMTVLAFSFFFSRHKIFLFLPVYVFIRIFKVVDSFLFSRAMAGTGRYVNCSIMEYFLSFGFPGQSIWVIGTVIAALLIFCWLACRYAAGREWL